MAETFDRTLAHLVDNKLDPAALQMRVGPVLAFDAQKETFVDRPDADAHLTREYRAPFVVPAAGEV